MSQVSAAVLPDTAGCAAIYTKRIVGRCGFHPLGWVSTETRPRHAPPSTQMRPTRVDGKTTSPGAGTRSSVFPQITATLRRVGETSGGGGGGGESGRRALPRRCGATTNTPPWTGSDEWDSWAMRSSIEHAGKTAKDWENGSRQSGD